MLADPGTLRSGRLREASAQYRSTCDLLRCVGSRFLHKITRNFQYLSFATLALTCSYCAVAQDSGAAQSGWYVYDGDHPMTPKWAIHLEGEWRRTPFLIQPEQRLLKTGVQRKFGAGWTVLVGYTYVVNSPPYDSTRVFGTESRHALIQQVANKQKFRSLQLSQWVRLANTFASLRAKDQTITWSFRQRVQYHVAVEIPAFGRRLPFAPSYYPIYDEVTLSIHPSPDHEVLTQNRVYAALGWKIGEYEAVELGYMHQFRPVSNGIVARHNDSLQVTVHSARPFTKFLSKHRYSMN